MKKIAVVLLALAMTLTLAACGQEAEISDSKQASVQSETSENHQMEQAQNQDSTSAYPIALKDHFDRVITIEEKPSRVISLAPSLTETIFALGAEDVLKGRTDFCTYPADVDKIPSVGTLKDPNIETIAEIAPDLILASTHFQEETMKKIEELGFKVVILSPQDSFEGVYDVVEKAGLILDKKDEADQIVNDMKDKVEYIEQTVAELEPTNVYYVVGYGEYGDYTAGSGTFIDQMITMAGGKNAAADTEGWTYSLEKLVEKDPYLLICSKYFDTKAGIEAANGYKDLTAVREGRLYEIDNDLLDRQGPRLAEGLEALAQILHPDAFVKE